MKSLRKALFWLHLCAALAAGGIILLLSATGLLLAFEVQVQAWADRHDRLVAPTPEGGAPAIGAALRAVGASRPELAVTTVTVRSEPGAALALGLGRDGVLYVDPASGAITGPGGVGVRRFFRGVTELHRFLGASGEARDAGKRVTGVSNLLFAVILLSGLYIWLPRAVGRDRWRNNLWFRGGLSPKARDFSWHHVFGIWALLPLLLIVVSALPISFEWAGRAVMAVTGSPTESRPAGEARPDGRAPAAPPSAATPAAPAPRAAAPPSTPRAGAETPKLAAIDLAGLDAAVTRAIAETPEWRALSFRLPARGDGAWTVNTDLAPRRGRPDARARFVVDATGETLLESERFADQSLGRRVRSWMRWIHTGEAGGVAGQSIGAIACAAVLILGWTGYALAWRRFRAWRVRRRNALREQPTAAPGGLPASPSPIED
jgi:uncharacterized iron-regulated membrane protein